MSILCENAKLLEITCCGPFIQLCTNFSNAMLVYKFIYYIKRVFDNLWPKMVIFYRKNSKNCRKSNYVNEELQLSETTGLDKQCRH